MEVLATVILMMEWTYGWQRENTNPVTSLDPQNQLLPPLWTSLLIMPQGFRGQVSM